MLVALNWNQHFRPRKVFSIGACAVGLRLVPFLIELRSRVNVVLGRVAVGDADLLIDLNAHHVRCVVATILIELDSSCRRWPGVVADLLAAVDGAFLDVDKHVGELAVFNDRVVGRQVRILLAADRIGRSVDLLRRRRRAVKGDHSADRAGRPAVSRASPAVR